MSFSVCRFVVACGHMEQLGFQWTDFHKISYSSIIRSLLGRKKVLQEEVKLTLSWYSGTLVFCYSVKSLIIEPSFITN